MYILETVALECLSSAPWDCVNCEKMCIWGQTQRLCIIKQARCIVTKRVLNTCGKVTPAMPGNCEDVCTRLNYW